MEFEEKKKELIEKFNSYDDKKKELIIQKIKYKKLQNEYNNELCTNEFKDYIEKLISIDNFDMNWINYDINLDEEEENFYLTTKDINVNEIVEIMRNVKCDMVIYEKNNIEELGKAFDLDIYFYNDKKDKHFNINYTYINDKDIYYEVIYDNKNMSKIFNFVDFMVNIKDKLEYFD
jgi:hypothetical protein